MWPALADPRTSFVTDARGKATWTKCAKEEDVVELKTTELKTALVMNRGRQHTKSKSQPFMLMKSQPTSPFSKCKRPDLVDPLL